MLECSICKSRQWKFTLKTANIFVHSCSNCGIDHCEHIGKKVAISDYDNNWQQASPEYLGSLSSLRQSQAKKIVTKMMLLFDTSGKWCDFGTGRGWFPIRLKEVGIDVVGVDASINALEHLKRLQIETAVVDNFKYLNALIPNVTGLSLLDVLEHFKLDVMPAFLQTIASHSTINNLIVKVPLKSGFFYRLAKSFVRLGFTGPFETLYQVGTNPPHEVYFTESAIIKLFSQYNFKMIAISHDADFEPKNFLERVLKRKFPIPLVSTTVGFMLGKIISLCKAEDSAIFFFKKNH
jgi:hypothetical protein